MLRDPSTGRPTFLGKFRLGESIPTRTYLPSIEAVSVPCAGASSTSCGAAEWLVFRLRRMASLAYQEVAILVAWLYNRFMLMHGPVNQGEAFCSRLSSGCKFS